MSVRRLTNSASQRFFISTDPPFWGCRRKKNPWPPEPLSENGPFTWSATWSRIIYPYFFFKEPPRLPPQFQTPQPTSSFASHRLTKLSKPVEISTHNGATSSSATNAFGSVSTRSNYDCVITQDALDEAFRQYEKHGSFASAAAKAGLKERTFRE